MKKLMLLLLLFVLSSVSVSAQLKVGKIKQDFRYGTAQYDCIPKGNYVGYTENKDGTTSMGAFGEYGLDEEIKISTSKVNFYIAFTGYYYGEVTDPVDDFVYVRKGPGTNYPVVGRLLAGYNFYFKKTETNWLKVYGNPEMYNDVFIWEYFGNLDSLEKNGAFLGYIYKDRMRNPTFLLLLE